MTAGAQTGFGTDHLLGDLRGRSVRGGAVTLTTQAAKFCLQLISTAVLARLLTPEDFGFIAMTAAFTGFVSLFKDLGLSAATVQRKDIDHGQINTLFWVNVVLSLALMALTAAVAPLIAWFYGELRLTPIVMAVGCTFLFGGLTAQHTALMRRQMRYQSLALVEVAGAAAGMIAGVSLAWSGAGYWALIGMGAASAAVGMCLVWALSPWRPGRPSWSGAVGPLLRLGGNLTGSTLANYITRNLDNVLIGWYWGAGPLGLYSKAYNLLLLPIRQINMPISAVALPALCRLQDSGERFRSFYLKATLAIAITGMPVVVCTFVLADELVLTVMGSQWVEAILIYRILAIVAFIDTTNVALGWIFIALGQTDRLFRWQVLDALVTATAFAIGLPWGVTGVAVSFCVSRCVLRYPGVRYCFRYAPVSSADFGGALWRPAVAAIGSGALVFGALSVALPMPTLLRLMAGTSLYALCYLACWVLLPGGRDILAQLIGAARELRARPVASSAPVGLSAA